MFVSGDGIGGTHIFTSHDEFGCEKYFLPQSRIDALVINSFD